MKNIKVCEDFIRNRVSKTKHLFIKQQKNRILVLYSYGYHFPMVIKLLDGTYIINLDGYSNTTARHKGDFVRALGFNNFEDLKQNKPQNVLFYNTVGIDKILNLDLLNKAEVLEQEI